MALSIDGLITGIDTKKIIDGMLAIQKSRVDTIKTQRAKVTTEQTAFVSYEAQLLSLQSSLRPLSSSASNAFEKKIAKSSVDTAVTATANTRAINGTYRIKVEQLAANHQIATQSFADPEQEIATGSLTIAVGSESKTVTITNANNTMQGLANAINASGAEVSATIVATGTSSDPAYRLLLSSNKTGAASKITITNALSTLPSGAIRPAFDEPFIADATSDTDNVGTSKLSSLSGYQTYTGGVDDTFTFSVATGGTVGTTNGIVVNYSNRAGTKTGSITFNAGDVGVAKNVVDGLQVKLGAGTLSVGDTFSVDVFAKQPPVQEARDAVIAFGEGATAIRLNSKTNTVSNALPGVSLDLLKADPKAEIELVVAADKEAITESVNDFVTAYNSFMEFVREQTKFVAESNAAGPLISNRAIQSIGSKIRSELVRSVPGLEQKIASLRDMGISLDASQRMTLRTDQLHKIIDGESDTATLNDLKRLFAFDGESDNPSIRFVSASPNTFATANGPGRDGDKVKVEVKVTRAATRASLQGSAIAASTSITSSNNGLTIKVHGQEKTITLDDGSYTREELAVQIGEKLTAAYDGAVVSVAVANDGLRITTKDYGTAATLQVIGGTATIEDLGLTAGARVLGNDVVGQFVVRDKNNNILATETATGKGQLLRGQSRDEQRLAAIAARRARGETRPEQPTDADLRDALAITADLQVQVSLGPDDVASEVDSTMILTQGLGFRLQKAIAESVDNNVLNAKNGFVAKLESIDESLSRVDSVFNSRKESLLRQFASLEQSVSGLNSVSQLVTGQLAGLRFQK